MSGTSHESKRAARERLAEQRAQQQAAERRRERLLRGGLIGLVFVLVAGIGIAVWASKRTPTDESVARPAGVQADLGVPVGTAEQPVVDLYEDFQCPACKQFEDTIGPTLTELASSGKAKVVYHVLSFLDGNLGNDASKRAANAAGCAQDQGRFQAFHDEVYKNQPEKEGTGYTDDQLLAFGRTAGVPDMTKFEACLKDGTFNGWATQVQRKAGDRQVTGTPTVFVAGQELNLRKLGSWDAAKAELVRLVEAAG